MQRRAIQQSRMASKPIVVPLAPISLGSSTMGKPVLAQAADLTSSKTALWMEALLKLAEARLRQLVAERLGVDPAQLDTHSNLAQDLGADEIDLLEIAVAAEEEFGVVVSDAALGGVRTYGDLWAAFALLLQNLTDSDAAELLASGTARVRVIRHPPDNEGGTLRATRITPRVVENLIDEVSWTKGAVGVEVTCAPDTTDRQLACIAQRLACLRDRGVQVSVQRTGPDTAPSIGNGRHAPGDTSSQSVAPHAEDHTGSPPSSGGIGFAD
jgi:acyl carrier protein